jgi:WD40 repeat protein
VAAAPTQLKPFVRIHREWLWAIAISALQPTAGHGQSGGQQPRLVIQAGHAGAVSQLAFSPDDKLLATGGADRTVKIWDVASLREVRTLTGHEEAISALAFAGTTVISADRAGEVVFQDVATGATRLKFNCSAADANKRFSAGGLALSPDGRTIAVACSDRVLLSDNPNFVSKNVVTTWDVATGKLLKVLAGHTRSITSVGFASDGLRVIAAGMDGSVRVWDTRNGAQLLQLEAGPGIADAAAFSPDRRWIASAARGSGVRLWEAASGREVLAMPDASANVTDLRFVAGGRLLVGSDDAGVLRTWELPSGKLLGRHSRRTDSIAGMAVSHDDSTVAVSDYRGWWLWDLTKPDSALREVPQQSRIITGLAMSPEGSTLATANGLGGNITLWSVAQGRPASVLETRVRTNAEESGGIAFSPTKGDLTGLSETEPTRGSEVKIWRHAGNVPATRRGVSSAGVLAYTPDGHLLAVAGEQLSLLDAAGDLVPRVLADAPRHAAYVSVAFSHDGARLVAVNTETGIEDWDVRTGTRTRLFDDALCATKAAFLPNDTARLGRLRRRSQVVGLRRRQGAGDDARGGRTCERRAAGRRCGGSVPVPRRRPAGDRACGSCGPALGLVGPAAHPPTGGPHQRREGRRFQSRQPVPFLCRPGWNDAPVAGV